MKDVNFKGSASLATAPGCSLDSFWVVGLLEALAARHTSANIDQIFIVTVRNDIRKWKSEVKKTT